MTKKIIILLALVFIFGLGVRHFVNAAPEKKSGEQSPQQQQVISVEAQKVGIGNVERIIDAVGTLVSNESVVLSPEIAGRIVEISFEEGQRVEKGQMLIQLDDAIARAELLQMETSLTLSRANYNRAIKLFEQDAESGSVRDEALAKRDTDQAAVELAKARLDKMFIRAPFDGVIGLRNVSIGDYVSPGQALVNIESIHPLKLDFKIPEIYLSSLKIGQKVQVMVDAFAGRNFEGEVYAMNPLVEAGGRTISLRALLPNEDGVLRPGLFARVRLVLGTKQDAVLIPEEAIVPQAKGVIVYKIVEGRAVPTPIQTGTRREGGVEVTQGLQKDDIVVTAGQMKLRPDALVKIIETPTPSGNQAR